MIDYRASSGGGSRNEMLRWAVKHLGIEWMLPSTAEEQARVKDYYLWQSPKASVKFLQKVYSEVVAGHKHDVWDIHASDGRWWVITNPTNLYSQRQFPNMDYAVTFHLGICLRIPRTDEQRGSESYITHFSPLLNQLHELPVSLSQAKETSDYQSIGMKSRELLLQFIDAAQDIIDWQIDSPPQRANFRSWVDIMFNTILGGSSQEARRHLFKTILNEAWTFTNWLTHAKSATWHDAEAAQIATEHAISAGVFLLLRATRAVPDECPKCGSPHLSPQEAGPDEQPTVVWERPVCNDCGWTGVAVRTDVDAPKTAIITREGGKDTGECIIPNVPLTKLAKPGKPRSRR